MQAAGHVYHEELEHGIEWLLGEARLWQDGKVVATAAHNTVSAWDFWYHTHFVQCFPQVTHWWFGSSWTQAMRVSLPQGMIDTRTIFGSIQWVGDQYDPARWTVYRDTVLVVAVPPPPMEEDTFAINVPLHIATMQFVLGMIMGRVQPDTWYTVSSLVGSNQLARQLPTTEHPTWRAERYRLPLRAEWCSALGLVPRIQRSDALAVA